MPVSMVITAKHFGQGIVRGAKREEGRTTEK